MLKSIRMYISQTSSVSEATGDCIVFLLAFVIQWESMFTKLWAQCLLEYCSMGVNWLLFSSVQSLSHAQLFATPWTAARHHSRSLLKLMSIESVMPSSHLILCCPLLLLPSIFPSIRVFSKESVLRITWPKYCSFNFSISPTNEYSGLISFRMDWLDLLAV